MNSDDHAGDAPAPAPRKQPRFIPVAETTWKARVISFLIAWIIRLYGLTLRMRVVDEGKVSGTEGGVIWGVWHNRLLTLPLLYRRWVRHRRLHVLTSPSRDGAVLAALVKRFGMGIVRGSSNKRAAQALVECRRRLQNGDDIGITPDGPRGPLYVVAPGVVQLARLTGRPLVPIRVEYSRKWRLKSWDRFQIPWPFSRVTFTALPPLTLGDESVEESCRRLAEILGNNPET